MAKRVMPIKINRVELDGDYEGWWIDVRMNPPIGELMDLGSRLLEAQAKINTIGKGAKITAKGTKDFGDIISITCEVIELVAHKWNFVDERGKDLSLDEKGIRNLPADLLMLVGAKAQEAVLEVPLAPNATS